MEKDWLLYLFIIITIKNMAVCLQNKNYNFKKRFEWIKNSEETPLTGTFIIYLKKKRLCATRHSLYLFRINLVKAE